MEIIRQVTVKLTKTDLKDIIFEYLKSKGMEVNSITFNVTSSNDMEDYSYELENVTCTVTEIN